MAPTSNVMRTVLAMALCCVAGVAGAQTTVSTVPVSPAAGEAVTLLLFNPCGCPWYSTPFVRNGFTIDVPSGDTCLSACLAQTTRYELGPLEPGTYTVRHFLEGDPGTAEVIGMFVVGEGTAVPALGVEGAIALTILLALAAWRLLRSRALHLR